MLLKYLTKHRYKGKIYPINPKYGEIGGHKCYPSLADVPEAVDMALIIIAAKHILPTLKQCAVKGVKSAIVFSSGFAEMDDAGRSAQKEIRAFCEREGISLCGPNCQGTVNVVDSIVMGSSPALEEELKKGSVGFVAQSGAFGFVTFLQAQDEHLGFSYFVSTGNEAVLGAADYMEYMVEDDITKVIISYMEGVNDGERFKAVTRKAFQADIPLIIFKVGRTETGKRAISSHTAALAGSDAVFSAFFRQKGIIRAHSGEEMIDYVTVFANGRRSRGKRAGILSTSGGTGIMMVDTLLNCGMEVPQLSQESIQAIERIVPPYGSVLNPVDVTAQIFGNPAYMKMCLQVLADDPNIDCLLVSLSNVSGQMAEIITDDIIEIFNATDKPMIVSWGAPERMVGRAFVRLREAGIPLYREPLRGARAMAILANYSVLQAFKGSAELEEVMPLPHEVSDLRNMFVSYPEKVLTEDQSKQLLACAGVPVTKEVLVKDEEEAVTAAGSIGFPVALKAISPKILHKTETGVVALNIPDEGHLRQTFRTIRKRALEHVSMEDVTGILVQEMLPKGIEAVIGMKNDSVFGPTIMFGLGGVMVEVLEDVSLKVGPLSKADVLAMLDEIKGSRILKGFRGQPAIDKESLVDAILNVSKLSEALKDEVAEIDLNPVILYPEGLKVVDALVIRKECEK